MGIGIGHGSSCSCDRTYDRVVYVDKQNPIGNPNPNRFKIIEVISVCGYIIATVQYPDCKNYEGKKIMVYKDTDINQFRKQKFIDPHFCEGSHLSPIARFEPTEAGKQMAVLLCEAIGKKQE